jgi:putative DNA-invertase from lambdoid prophage Rac
MTMAIWGYARVEYAGDATIGEQRRWIKAYALGQNMKLERVVIEQRGVRAYTPVADRPIGGPLFEKLVKGDIVIVALLDRLFGSAVDALKVVADLESRGVGLHILDLGGDMAGEGEIGHRLAEAIRQRKKDDKARGRYAGGTVPFGFERSDDGKLAKDKAKQQAIALMVEMKADGKSLRGIAAAVAAQGFKITHAGVAGILKAHKYDVWKVEKLRAQAEEAQSHRQNGTTATPTSKTTTLWRNETTKTWKPDAL